MTDSMNIATTIKGQIHAYGAAIVWSWGARQWAAMPATERFNDHMLGGLKFRVSGRKFKGNVIVWLCANDTYTVEFGNFSRKRCEFVTKQAMEMIYCDQLTDVIDTFVETN